MQRTNEMFRADDNMIQDAWCGKLDHNKVISWICAWMGCLPTIFTNKSEWWSMVKHMCKLTRFWSDPAGYWGYWNAWYQSNEWFLHHSWLMQDWLNARLVPMKAQHHHNTGNVPMDRVTWIHGVCYISYSNAYHSTTRINSELHFRINMVTRAKQKEIMWIWLDRYIWKQGIPLVITLVSCQTCMQNDTNLVWCLFPFSFHSGSVGRCIIKANCVDFDTINMTMTS